MESLPSTLLPALLEKSLTVTVLAVLLGCSLWFNYKQWVRGNTQTENQSIALAALNQLRMEEAAKYAAGRKDSSDHLRAVVDRLSQVLTGIDNMGKGDDKTRHLIALIAAELKIPVHQLL